MKFFISFSFLLAVSVAASTARAQISPPSCYEVDLRSQFSVVHNQGGADWCYAFVMAALASQKLGHDISPIDIANSTERVPAPLVKRIHDTLLLQQQPPRRMVFEGQGYAKALQAAQKKGFCLEANLPSSGLISPATDLKVSLESIDEVASKDPLRLQAMAPKVSPQDLIALVKNTKGGPLIDRIDDVACRQRLFPSQPWQLGFQREDFEAKDVQSKIATVGGFLKSHVPLAIAMDAQLFYDAHWGDDLVPADGRRSEHAVIIVGQHWDEVGKSCQYIVRDSYGTACDRYRKDMPCAGGYYFLPREQLMNVTWEINYLK